MMKKLLSIGLVMLGALAVHGASAGAITMHYDNFVNGSRTGTINGQRPSPVTVRAGQFNFDQVQGPEPFWDGTLQAFCIDVTENLVTKGSVTYSIATARSDLSSNQFSLISQLYDQRARSLGTALNDAAFQLALWEVMYDSKPLSLLPGDDRGNFWASSDFGEARERANEWLTGLTLGDAGEGYTSRLYEFYVLNPHYPTPNQKLLVARSVPEAGALGLLGLGLVALGTLRRRTARR